MLSVCFKNVVIGSGCRTREGTANWLLKRRLLCPRQPCFCPWLFSSPHAALPLVSILHLWLDLFKLLCAVLRSVVSEPGIKGRASNYIQQILWDVITCPYPWGLLLAQHSSIISRKHNDIFVFSIICQCWDSTDILKRGTRFSCTDNTIGSDVLATHGAGLVTVMGSAWWRHQMETFSALLALCEGNSPVTGGFPSQRSVTWELWCFLSCTWKNGWVNNRDAGDLRRHCAHYEVTLMES